MLRQRPFPRPRREPSCNLLQCQIGQQIHHQRRAVAHLRRHRVDRRRPRPRGPDTTNSPFTHISLAFFSSANALHRRAMMAGHVHRPVDTKAHVRGPERRQRDALSRNRIGPGAVRAQPAPSWRRQGPGPPRRGASRAPSLRRRRTPTRRPSTRPAPAGPHLGADGARARRAAEGWPSSRTGNTRPDEPVNTGWPNPSAQACTALRPHVGQHRRQPIPRRRHRPR